MESYEILWKTALDEIEKTVSTISFEAYVKMLEPVDVKASTLVLITKTKLFADHVADNLKNKIVAAVSKVNPSITEVEICVFASKEDYYKDALEKENSAPPIGSAINPKFTFDNFVVGSSNQMIYAAAKAVAENPGDAFNPLFIYGGSGLGKTHILMAIANYLKINSPQINVLYATCDQFTNQFITSLSRGKRAPEDFRNKYRNVDVLLIDDVQFLSKKPETQTEFFHTFNELIMQNKQIVLTCDRPPKEINVLEDRLRTRFEGGLLADVQPPDLETKIAILKKKSEEQKTYIELKVLSYIAEKSDLDVRSLIGRLTKVIFASKLLEKPITIDLVNEALKESAGEIQEELQVDDIIKCVSDFYHISKSDLVGKKKNKEFTEPRHVCIYLITELMSLPQEFIGQKMGKRDHTTVIYARNRISELIKNDEKLATEINDLKNMLLKK